jgi:two-component system, LytTR family, sensor histidine kinase AlgZ
VASINQTGAGIRLPNFCNVGVMLRSLVVVNALLAAAAVIRAPSVGEIWFEFLIFAAFGEPVLILSLVVLCWARRWLHAIGYVGAIALLAAFEMGVTWLLYDTSKQFDFDQLPMTFGQVMFLVFFVTAVTIAYFDLRARALSPAIAEARIQALQARIRPHFLYNSINAVLSLIRSEPRRAERALEDLADLFRVLMADNRTLAPIATEVELARQYLALEELRLGERLRITWRTGTMPADALVPPLILQPLVENAVYHGIEPMEAGGEIEIDVALAGAQLVMDLKNPYSGTGKHMGNRMAIENIRERLQLHFDAEASMRSEVKDGTYRVTIRIPYIKAGA